MQISELRSQIGRRLLDFHLRMSGRLTPPEQLPPPDRIQSWLLPIADLFMVLMYSRPPGGSLRTARVTLVTIGLSLTVLLVAGAGGLFLTIHAAAPLNPLLLVAGLAALGLGLGSGVLALFGIRQRRLLERGPDRRAD